MLQICFLNLFDQLNGQAGGAAVVYAWLIN